MIENSYEFRIDEHVVEVRVQQIGNEFELWFDGPWESKRVFVLDKDDLVGLYRWLGRNLGPFGEDWKSIVDSDTNWPESMSREDLYELAEIQQEIIKSLDGTMDEEAKDILRDIRDSLQNIEESVTDQTITVDTGSFTATSPAGPVTVSSDIAAEKITDAAKEVADDYAEEAEKAVDNYYDETSDEEFAEDVEDSVEGVFSDDNDTLRELKEKWFESVRSEYPTLTIKKQGDLISALQDADNPIDVAYAAHDFMQELDQPTVDDALEEARKQIQS